MVIEYFLPVYPKLKNKEIDYISNIINSFINNENFTYRRNGFIGHNL